MLRHPGQAWVLDGSVTIRWGGIAWPGIQSFRNTRGKVEMADQRPPVQSSGACHSAVWDCRPWGVAKSVCHRDRRSLPNRQLRCLCRTDFGSPSIIRAHLRLYPVYLREPLEPWSCLFKSQTSTQTKNNRHQLFDNRKKYPIHSAISFTPPSLAATGFGAIILRSSLTRL